MKYVLRVDRALAIFSQEEEKEKIWLIQDTRFVSILFILILFLFIQGVVLDKWRMVLILAMVQDFAFGERYDILFNSASPSWIKHQSFTLYAKSRTIARSTIRHLYNTVHYHTHIGGSGSWARCIFTTLYTCLGESCPVTSRICVEENKE